MEIFNSSPDAVITARYEEFDEKLAPIFSRYLNEGKIIDGKISGVDYSRLQQEVVALVPEMTASVFNPYLFQHKSIMIYGRPDYEYKTAPQSTRRVIRPATPSKSASATAQGAGISFKNAAANDDTPDLTNTFFGK